MPPGSIHSETCHPTPLVDILLQLNIYSARLTSSTPGSTVLGYAYEPWDIQVCHSAGCKLGCPLHNVWVSTQNGRVGLPTHLLVSRPTERGCPQRRAPRDLLS